MWGSSGSFISPVHGPPAHSEQTPSWRITPPQVQSHRLRCPARRASVRGGPASSPARLIPNALIGLFQRRYGLAWKPGTGGANARPLRRASFQGAVPAVGAACSTRRPAPEAGPPSQAGSTPGSSFRRGQQLRRSRRPVRHPAAHTAGRDPAAHLNLDAVAPSVDG